MGKFIKRTLARLNQSSTQEALPVRSQGNEGFTLIETSIALLVMMVAALAVTSLFTFAISYNSDASDRAVALAVAQQRMERLRTLSFTDASLAEGTTSENVTFVDRQYTVTTTIGGSTTLKTINIQVLPLAAVRPWAAGPVTVVSLRTIAASGPYLK